jgi:hypothetical protein
MSFIDVFEELKRSGSFAYDPTKSHAYTCGIFKTAALFFDKVYIDKFDYITLSQLGDEHILF